MRSPSRSVVEGAIADKIVGRNATENGGRCGLMVEVGAGDEGELELSGAGEVGAVVQHAALVGEDRALSLNGIHAEGESGERSEENEASADCSHKS